MATYSTFSALFSTSPLGPARPSISKSTVAPSARKRNTRPVGFSSALSPWSVKYRRSEEHTSELQSLMRISYAVFCLKKKNKDIKTTQNHENPQNNNTQRTSPSIHRHTQHTPT